MNHQSVPPQRAKTRSQVVKAIENAIAHGFPFTLKLIRHAKATIGTTVTLLTSAAPSSFGDQRQRLSFTEAETFQDLRHPGGPGHRAAGLPFPDGKRRHFQKLRDLLLCGLPPVSRTHPMT